MPLTDIAIKNAKPKSKPHKMSDGEGLFLLVAPSGFKSWHLAYRFEGLQKKIALGKYPQTSLRDARDKRHELRKAIEAGSDPLAEKTEKRKKAQSKSEAKPGSTTFKKIANEWLSHQETEKHSEQYAATLGYRFREYLFPRLGDLEITAIKPAVLLEALKEIEAASSADVARRLKAVCGQVFRYAMAKGVAENDPSAALLAALPPKPKVRHHPSLKAAEIPEFLEKLTSCSAARVTKLATIFTMLTAVRTSETRFAPWSEIENLDSDLPLWRIPPERMKMERPHLVPLSSQAVVALKQARRLHPNSKIIFPSDETRSGIMTASGMLTAIYHAGFKGRTTTHGLRSTFSTITNESEDPVFHSDWIEMALAHSEEDEVRDAYNAATWLPQRRRMLQWWSDYLAERGLSIEALAAV